MDKIFTKRVDTFPQIYRTRPSVIQVNVGKRCNMTCEHCHVSAGPDRTEDLSKATADKIIDFMKEYRFEVGDITGGAPEINAQFPQLLETFTRHCRTVIVRCNLTAAMSQRQKMAELFTKYTPVIVASLPCYSEENVDKQRGDGAFQKSIKALKWLNELGYGRERGKTLTLVYNPLKPILPPNSRELEKSYKQHLKDEFDIVFNDLIAIANVPVGRYQEHLEASGQYAPYMKILKNNFNSATLEGLMCRNHINVDWQGNVFDCDFNNQIELSPYPEPKKLWDLRIKDWIQKPIAVADHCFTCTAGCGSSCGGSVA